MDLHEKEVVEETDDYILITVGQTQWILPNGYYALEKDYRVGGEVWRVHKNDPDPLPSRPHAHCIDGRKRFIGLKLHLGTAELFEGPRPVGRRLDPKQFDRLIELIRPKFPGIVLPLA